MQRVQSVIDERQKPLKRCLTHHGSSSGIIKQQAVALSSVFTQVWKNQPFLVHGDLGFSLGSGGDQCANIDIGTPEILMIS